MSGSKPPRQLKSNGIVRTRPEELVPKFDKKCGSVFDLRTSARGKEFLIVEFA
jgi:hypothetical protein